MIAKYRISEDDYVNAMKLYGQLTPRAVIILAASALLLLVLTMLSPPALRSAGLGGIIGGGIVMVLLRYVVSPFIGRRQYKKYKAIQEEFTIELFPDSVHIHAGDSYSKIKWANIQKWRHSNDYLLMFPMPRIYYVVPKSVSSDGFDIASLMDRLTQHVGKPS